MTEAPPHQEGWRLRLRRMAAAFMGLLRNRLELFALEWEEEKERLLRFAVRLTCFLLVGSVGLLLLLGVAAWVVHRVLGIWGLLALGVACLGVAFWGLRSLIREVRAGPRPFAQTVAEFRKDSAWLSGNHPTRTGSE